MPQKKEKKISFEDGLNRLEEIVSILEKGEVSLEDSLELFKEGIELANSCNKKLKNAELTIQKLTNWDGEVEDFVIEEKE